MKYEQLLIEKREYVFLKRILNLSGYHKDISLRYSLRKLMEELNGAKILDEAFMPDDVIRFNSEIVVVSGNGWSRQFQLVLPSKADIKNNKISILTPMGAAVMGYASGDDISWEFPGGKQSLKVEQVKQSRNPIDLTVHL